MITGLPIDLSTLSGMKTVEHTVITKMSIEKIEQLGTGSPPVENRWPIGKTESNNKYYSP
jgi:hypothetical protein